MFDYTEWLRSEDLNNINKFLRAELDLFHLDLASGKVTQANLDRWLIKNGFGRNPASRALMERMAAAYAQPEPEPEPVQPQVEPEEEITD